MTAEDEVEASFRGVISIENTKQQLGWTPRYSSLREGISEYIESYRAFLAGGGNDRQD
jgi:nucleoside-diphosphate-sugar epimerase